MLGKFFSGIGGQVDFVRGAARSRGGRSIIALRSTAQRGTVSRIQAAFEAGAGIVTSRGDVRFVVTEYGVADLWGKSVRERALALIEVAHPSFRAELLAQAKQRRYVFVDQKVPSAIYPWREHSLEKSKDDVDIIVCPVRMSDEEALQDLFYSLSDEDARERFMTHKNAYPHAEMQQLVDADYVETLALVATDPRTAEIIGMARYDMDPATRFGDIAFAVRDNWQRRGIGGLLMRRMLDAARANGLRGFSADVLAGNRGMLMVFQQSGLTVQSRFDGACYHLEMPFDAPPPLSQLPAPPATSSRSPALRERARRPTRLQRPREIRPSAGSRRLGEPAMAVPPR